MDRAVIPSACGADRHRLTGCPRSELAGIHRPIVQHHAVGDVVYVVPYDLRAGRKGRRIWGERLRPIDRDDVDRHDAWRTGRRTVRVSAITAVTVGTAAAPPNPQSEGEDGAYCHERTHVDVSA